ncbi:hypothetical protein [Polymorphospora sp. NPDC050346]|uniref:hypothetical protein n=1 Tax=Polymorphospora sp. NPDC050346 TaxID=3155780 RepID=UPI0033F53E71
MQHPKHNDTMVARQPRLRLDHGTRLLIAVAATVACTSCSSGPASISTAATTPTLFVHDVRGSGTTAEINGYLRYLSDLDCFVLESGPEVEGLARQVAVWPPGTKVWRRDGQVAGVEVPDTGKIPLGGRIVGSGGYANANNGFAENLPDVSPECLTSGGEFALMHKISKVT